MIFSTYKNFSPQATALRAHFDSRFANPHRSSADRFVWDYWHIEDEYTFVRTPAFHYFPQTLYRRFHTHLVNWGRANLGCHDISPTWLSYYAEGCQQHLHRDEPHGPLAFVLSLTPWTKRKFTGGETIIQNERGFDKIPALFNQLLIFNPALSHGVQQVRGVHDPREARLVLHGWFVQPRVFWKGPLTAKDVGPVLNRALKKLARGHQGLEGFVSWRLSINKTGRVTKIDHLLDTLSEDSALEGLREELMKLEFPAQRASSVLTLPLVFRSGS